MRTRTVLPAVLLALGAGITACSSTSSTEASTAACKDALAKQLHEASQNGKKGTHPPSCEGLDTKTLERLVGEVTEEWLDSEDADKVVSDALDDAFGDGLPVPEVTETETEASVAGISDECREWIEGELLDSSTDVDGTAGYGACGDLSDEELDLAIEDVTDDLIEQGATAAP